METYERDLMRFDELCEELIHSKFIVAEVKIMKLLKCIADSQILLDSLEKCLQGFNYEYEYLKAKVPSEDPNSPTKFTFQLPVEPSKKVALIFRILYDIDTKAVDLHKFINEFFVVEDEPYASFANFINSIVAPFKNDFEYIITGVKRYEEAPVVEYKEELKLQEHYLIDIIEILKKMNEMIDKEELKKGQKEEIVIVANGFANALISLSAEHILVSWVGFKNTVKDVKKALPFLKKIEDKLRVSGLFNV
ncbi:MAG: hypothetical protein RR107_01130 [Clostridia bacterium]